jgi:cob(I)alamin adenosyltransferase
MARLKKGFVHVYTGNGKGKTTAALGLALRAAGAGLKVFVAQFAKGIETGEVKLLAKFPRQITIKQFGARSFIRGHAVTKDRIRAAEALETVKEVIAAGRYDVVILDELCVVCDLKLISTKTVLDIITGRPGYMEVIITGRNAPKEIVETADLVTEMKEIRHYFNSGVKARKGIEY